MSSSKVILCNLHLESDSFKLARFKVLHKSKAANYGNIVFWKALCLNALAYRFTKLKNCQTGPSTLKKLSREINEEEEEIKYEK